MYLNLTTDHYNSNVDIQMIEILILIISDCEFFLILHSKISRNRPFFVTTKEKMN